MTAAAENARRHRVLVGTNPGVASRGSATRAYHCVVFAGTVQAAADAMKLLHRPDLFAWSRFDDSRNIGFCSVAWVRSGGNVLIDPLPI